MLSIDVIPVPTDEAVREMQNRLLGVETNVTNWQRRQNSNNNFSAVVPYDLEQQRRETREMLDDLTTRDQRMMFAVVTLVHLADSKEELDSDTEALQSIARKHLCQLATLNWQQAEGLVTALPLGLRRIDALRTLTTEALAVLMPFKAQEIRHQDGVYYGQNAISKNLILANRWELLNANGFVLGVSGSGKSFTAKREMVGLALAARNSADGMPDDIIVIDPEIRVPAAHRRAGRRGDRGVRHLAQPHQRHGYGAGLRRRREPRGAQVRVPAVPVRAAHGRRQAVRQGEVHHRPLRRPVLPGLHPWRVPGRPSPPYRTSTPNCSASRSRRRGMWRWPSNCSPRAA